MAVDPNTGQTIIPIGQQYAGYLDPASFGQLQADQGQIDQKSQLARAMMQQGYIPNSGWGGILTQVGSAIMGMKMLNDQKEQMAGINQRYLEAMSNAAKAKHTQDQGDLDAAELRAVKQATGIKEGDTQIGLKYAGQQSEADARAAAAKADALLPSEANKIKLETEGKIQAAVASAGEANRRGYVVSDASGNQHIITPQGKEIYQSSSPGGGKLTPTQTALNNVDEEKAKQLQVRQQAATQLQGNLYGWAAQYTGAKPEDLQKLTPQQVAEKIKAVPYTTAIGMGIDPRAGGLDAIGNDIGINAAGTKRASPTDAIIAAEQKNTMSRRNAPEKNASIFLNHINDIQNLQKDVEQTTNSIKARQAPGTGNVPQAAPGPTNPAPAQAISQDAILAELKRRAAQGNTPQDLTP